MPLSTQRWYFCLYSKSGQKNPNRCSDKGINDYIEETAMAWVRHYLYESLQQSEQDLAGASPSTWFNFAHHRSLGILREVLSLPKDGHGSPCKASMRERAAAWSKNYHAGVIFAFLRELLQLSYKNLSHLAMSLAEYPAKTKYAKAYYKRP